MNYIRGAVNAISAPYQYYKDLPPLNPSTLTGAIDIIVVSTPTEDGTDTELVGSPFHVRFGKWQVLRPADKKVNLTVNGRPIPFNMKIGEAGEAFFIFETAGDVPDDLITSPLVSATQSPNLEAQAEDAQTGSFGGKEDAVDQTPSKQQSGPSQEPEFLDLDASILQPATNEASGISLTKPDVEPPSEAMSPSSLLTLTSHQIKDQVQAAYNIIPTSYSLNGNEPVPHIKGNVDETPEPIYTDDVVLDIEGYHSHDKERSDRTITPHGSDENRLSSAQRTPGSSRSSSPVPHAASSSSPSIPTSDIPFPNTRATSEPPPDIKLPSLHVRHESNVENALRPPVDEYMWEWGAFPQKSPMKATHSELPDNIKVSWKEGQRSSTLPQPAHAFSSLPKEDVWSQESAAKNSEPDFGFGGRLRPDREDSYLFTLIIEYKTIQFELSIVPASRCAKAGTLGGDDELEDAKRFNDGKIDFWKFLDDETVLHDPSLVLRWGGDRYITRSDGSPLMAALSTWREATLQDKDTRSLSRSPSPSSRSDTKEGLKPVMDEDQNVRTTSTSWVRWWSRSRRTGSVEVSSIVQVQRPDLKETSSAPPETNVTLRENNASLEAEKVSLPYHAPTPPGNDTGAFEGESKKSKKRYAKTLRLTSDQLKMLDLKPGPNTVTFSLSATGAAACTARIFLWDHSDKIVVSDIDGTITKSDTLGHVFTMIGRDWTHLGVAKLYTDIRRNGFKFMYLTSRAIGQADATRYYLKGIKQNDYQLPEGPVIMSPDRLMASLHREVIMRKPEVFKMACLRDIRRLFGKTSLNPFYSGFGNRITDALSYRSVDIPSSRIFTIDFAGEVKMELLELAGYKSSYIHMTDLVDQIFPPIHRQFDSHFTDFNYWRPPMQDYELPEMTPPSPALSARSDTSNQSTLARLRNISLMGGRSSNTKQFSLPPPATERASKDGTERGRQNGSRESRLRQMSSLERFGHRISAFAPSSSSTAASPTASSSTFFDSGDEEEDEDGDLEKQKRMKKRVRRASMPGSLEGSGSDDENEHDEVDEGDEDYGEGEHEDEAAAEQAFDDDLFATGEMENVPFL